MGLELLRHLGACESFTYHVYFGGKIYGRTHSWVLVAVLWIGSPLNGVVGDAFILYYCCEMGL